MDKRIKTPAPEVEAFRAKLKDISRAKLQEIARAAEVPSSTAEKFRLGVIKELGFSKYHALQREYEKSLEAA